MLQANISEKIMATKIFEYSSLTERSTMKSTFDKKEALDGYSRPLPHPYNRRQIKSNLSSTGTVDPKRQVQFGGSEKVVLKQVKILLVGQQIWHRRLEGIGKIVSHGGNSTLCPGQMRGMPDLIAIIRGRLIAIEVKAAGGRISPAQYSTLQAMQKAGAYVCLSVDTEKLATALEMLLWSTEPNPTALVDGWLPVF
jgi:hypothetical protein